MNAQPMLPTPPDCGAPCALCEAKAHEAARLRTLVDIANQKLKEEKERNLALARTNADLAGRLEIARDALVEAQHADTINRAWHAAGKGLEKIGYVI